MEIIVELLHRLKLKCCKTVSQKLNSFQTALFGNCPFRVGILLVTNFSAKFEIFILLLGELSGNLKDTVVALSEPPDEFDANQLRKAMKVCNYVCCVLLCHFIIEFNFEVPLQQFQDCFG